MASFGLACPVWASSKSDNHEKTEEESGDQLHLRGFGEDNAPENSSVMPVLVAPVVENGKRLHYIYIAYRLVSARIGHVERIDAQIPILHDAFMRDAYRHSVTVAGEPDRLNQEGITERFRRIGAEILGEDIITDVYFMRIDKENEYFIDQEVPKSKSKSAAKPSSGGH